MVQTFTHNLCFEQKYENSKKNQLKIVIFTDVKNRCMLHGRVFVMRRPGLSQTWSEILNTRQFLCSVLLRMKFYLSIDIK